MEIKNSSPAIPAQGTTQQKAIANTWQVGQTLKAVVVENLPNNVKLRVDNTLIQAPTTKQHQSGETLLLTVMRSGDKPVLRVQAPLLPASQSLQAPKDSALKVLLPKQSPLTPLLANLSVISQLKSQLTAPLTTEISNSVKKLLDSIVRTDNIGDPKELRRAITDSGVLLEKKLANLSLSRGKGIQQATQSNTPLSTNSTQARPISQDFKANLVQLLDVLRLAPSNQNGSVKIPLPLPLPLQASGTTNTPNQGQSSAQVTTQSAKENLIRLLSTPASLTQIEKGRDSTLPLRLTELTSSLSRLPMPFFRHMQLQPQKAQIPTLALLQHRDQITDELIRQVEGSIARVQLSQLASIPQDSNAPPSWTLELPLRHGENVDIVQLRIEKEDAQDGDEKEARWQITLTLDMPDIGSIYANITVRGEHASTTLWAEDHATVKLIDNNLALLRDALEQHGVKTGEIRCQHGTPSAPLNRQRHTLLVDTQV